MKHTYENVSDRDLLIRGYGWVVPGGKIVSDGKINNVNLREIVKKAEAVDEAKKDNKQDTNV